MSIYTKVADDGGKWVEIGASSGGGPGAANFTDEPTDTYTEDGVNYKYITFTTGTVNIEFDVAGFADVLVVAGGGGGASSQYEYGGSGGGGAGGLIYQKVYLALGTYPVTIGAAGAAGGSNGVDGSNGGNSSFVGTSNSNFGLIATGGGGGGHGYTNTSPVANAGKNGGSGGGGAAGVGTGISWQGNNGTGLNGGGAAESGNGLVLNLTNENYEYARGGLGSNSGVRSQYGSGGMGAYGSSSPTAGIAGVVIVRVRTN